MCLEMVNAFIGLPFAWLGLALIALLVAALAAYYLMLRSRRKTTKTKPNPGFTCPCYAPPWSPSEKESK
jgi:hypothetical protein